MDFLTLKDIDSLQAWVEEARKIKETPLDFKHLGSGKTIGLLFFNPSLRTRLSTQKAAQNMGMDCMVMNFDNEGWALEYADGEVMDKGKSEHIREAAKVISQFCDIIAIRDHYDAYGAGRYKGAVTIGVCIHGWSQWAGHGPGLNPVITALPGKIETIIDPDANMAYYLGIRERPSR